MDANRAIRRTEITAEVIDAWLASLMSERTRSAYRSDLAAFTAWCAEHLHAPLQADRAAIGRYRAEREAGGTTAPSVARGMSAINGFFRFASNRGYIDIPVHQARPCRAPASSTTVPLTAEERAALLAAVPSQGTRSHVLVALLLLDGMKLDEVLRLDTNHIAGRRRRMTVAVPRAEGEQMVTLHPDTARAIALHLRQHGTGPLLTSDSRSRAVGRRLTRFGADYLLKKAGREAGLDAPLTANALRRTHVIHAHRHGRSLDDIRRQVGHDDIRTTRRYLEAAAGGQVADTNAGGAESRRRPDMRR